MAIFILGPDPDGNCCGCEGRASPCDTCGAPTECPCSLVLPPFNLAPDPSYEAAEDRLSDVVDCICYGPGSVPVSAVTANNTTPNEIELIADYTTVVDPTNSLSISMYNSITVADGSILTVTWDIPSRRTGGCIFYIYACDYTIGSAPIESYTITTNTGSQAMTALPAGTYVIISQAESALGEDHFQATFTITSSDTMVVNPASCRWDDSGTVRWLEACPKMLLPPLTESTGSWYASEAAAQAVLDDPLQTSSCIGYFDTSLITPSSSTATSGGTTITLSQTFGSPPGDSCPMWCSVNVEDGATLSFAFSGNGIPGPGDPPNAEAVIVSIYDYDGVLVYAGSTDGTTAGPLVSSALPYTGRYIVKVVVSCTLLLGTCFTSCSCTVSSSSTMSVNQIQALYDVGIDCPALLDC